MNGDKLSVLYYIILYTRRRDLDPSYKQRNMADSNSQPAIVQQHTHANTPHYRLIRWGSSHYHTRVCVYVTEFQSGRGVFDLYSALNPMEKKTVAGNGFFFGFVINIALSILL